LRKNTLKEKLLSVWSDRLVIQPMVGESKKKMNEGEKMKKSFALLTACVLIIVTSAACSSLKVKIPEPTATDMPQVNMPNPASVYCKQNGYTLEIVTADDGSQSGVCVFPDGSTCDEWAYFRGECGPATQTSPTLVMTSEATTEEVTDWWGVIKSVEPGAQFDDYFERQDQGQIILFGIDTMDSAVKSQIEALRDSGKIVHLYGTLFSNVPDVNGLQILVERIEVEP
jgi:putative hemolysin